MSLPGAPPQKGQHRLKLLLYGDWKTGKTIACTQFPKSFFIDAEKGAVHDSYVERMQAADARYFSTNSYEELIAAVRALISEKHDRVTLIVDPISAVYHDLVELGETSVGTGWGKHISFADTRMKRLFLLLDRLDMNIIFTSHAKNEYVRIGGEVEATGKLVADAWKRLEYYFDLIVELRRVGKDRVAEVRGSRLSQFPEGMDFDWSYEAFTSRLDRSSLERLAASVELISAEQAQEIEFLLTSLGASREQRAALLKHNQSGSWKDLSAVQAGKTLAFLRKRLEATAAESSQVA